MRHLAEIGENAYFQRVEEPPIIDHDPDEFEPKGLSPWVVVGIVAVLLGVGIQQHGSPSLGLGDDIIAVLFAAFCAWNYWPRKRQR